MLGGLAEEMSDISVIAQLNNEKLVFALKSEADKSTKFEARNNIKIQMSK